MAINCDPNALIAASTAAKFCCPSPVTLIEIQTYLLAVIAGGSTDPNTLASQAKGFQTLSHETLLQVQTFLLCQIAAASGA
jgi:hypothetical protein